MHKRVKEASVEVATLLSGLLLAGACAQPYAPTGGEKDTIPPQLLYSVPHQGQINYKEQAFLFVFDERIAEKSLCRQLILTPTSK